MAKLKEGQNIALVSDAGTPLINDPGYHLVRTCREAGIRVVPLPGPCAAIAALSAAGLPSDRFCYEGFLPAKSKGRRDVLKELEAEPRTLIFTNQPTACWKARTIWLPSGANPATWCWRAS